MNDTGQKCGTRFLRFADLKERGVINNWQTLRRWIEREAIPPGIMLGPNCRAWAEDEIDAWLDSRPKGK
jgi:predicted DNA-binding transcriptional regulator AlpA